MSSVAFKEEKSESRRSATLAIYRALDVLIAAISVILCLPLLLLICVAIRLEGGGPAIFRQRRLGRDKQPFTVHKFRTMTLAADPKVHRQYVEQLITGAETTHVDGDGQDLYKLAADDRVTRIGCFLRKTSLDELPQIFNVLSGEMSLVGPRPLVVDEDALVEGIYRSRLHLTPGMTGPWQILGSTRVPMGEMIGIDYLYVANWTLWQDIKILLRTVPHVLAGRGL